MSVAMRVFFFNRLAYWESTQVDALVQALTSRIISLPTLSTKLVEIECSYCVRKFSMTCEYVIASLLVDGLMQRIQRWQNDCRASFYRLTQLKIIS